MSWWSKPRSASSTDEWLRLSFTSARTSELIDCHLLQLKFAARWVVKTTNAGPKSVRGLMGQSRRFLSRPV